MNIAFDIRPDRLETSHYSVIVAISVNFSPAITIANVACLGGVIAATLQVAQKSDGVEIRRVLHCM